MDIGNPFATPQQQPPMPQNQQMQIDPNNPLFNQYFSRAINVPIWKNCCQTLTVRNTSDIPILVSNPNIIFARPDLAVTY